MKARPAPKRDTHPVRRFILASTLTCLGAALSHMAYANTASGTYQQFCASCHGKNLDGGLGPSLIDDEWKHGADAASIAKSINKGIPTAGMPAWERVLDANQVRALIIYIQEEQKRAKLSKKSKASNTGGVYKSELHNFTVEKFVDLPGIIWSISTLNNNTFIATIKDGRLFTITNGKAQEITGVPKVWNHSQAGMLEVMPHPEYAKNGWIYLSYVDEISSMLSSKGMTAIVRGKIKDNKWVEEQQIFKTDESFYLSGGVHFGSRFAFKDDYLFFSIGERGRQDDAQDLSLPNGKIHRIHSDGSIPKDNPFVNNKNAYPTIWSYGHRNTQGLAIHPVTGDLWETEHGPRGGDEVNIINPALNYGWPVITYGMNYNGTPMDATTHKEGMEQPLHYWVPSIATGGIDFYQGDAFPKWQNSLLASGMGSQELHRVSINDKHDAVTGDEILFKGLGRVRDVLSAPDGLIYVALNPNGGAPGAIYVLKPAK